MSSFEIILLAIFLLVYLLIFGFAIACYVVSSYASYTIAKRLCIKNPWLAWIPVGNYWIDGCIANMFDERNGYNRKWHKTLLVSAFITIGGVLFFYIGVMALAIGIGLGAIDEFDIAFMGGFIGMYLMIVPAVLAGAILQTCHRICRYKIFEALAPQKAIKYIILDTVIPMAGPICMLKNKDKCGIAAIVSESSVAMTEFENNAEDYNL